MEKSKKNNSSADRKSLDMLQKTIDTWLTKRPELTTDAVVDDNQKKKSATNPLRGKTVNLNGAVKENNPKAGKGKVSKASKSTIKISSTLFTKNLKKSENPKSKTKRSQTGVNVQEILKEQKDLESYRSLLNSFKPMDIEMPNLNLRSDEAEERPMEMLDCKHLTLEDVTEAFYKHRRDLSNILKGKLYNERHERYQNQKIRVQTHTVRDLTYNTSMIVFHFDQIKVMIDLMKEIFDQNDNMTDYFFKVLMPELCLRIFEDTHGMTRDEAVAYLDARPVE